MSVNFLLAKIVTFSVLAVSTKVVSGQQKRRLIKLYSDFMLKQAIYFWLQRKNSN
jgi:hypothetical protein